MIVRYAAVVSVMLVAAVIYFVSSRKPLVPSEPVAAVPGKWELPGGATTVRDSSINAFGHSAMNMEGTNWRKFYKGKLIFDRDWSDPKYSPMPVGPQFSAVSCAACHHKDGRGRPPLRAGEAPASFVVQLSALHGRTVLPDPAYGDQLDYHAVKGVQGEGTVEVLYSGAGGRFADGDSFRLSRPEYRFRNLAYGAFGSATRFSPRVAPVIFGLGLLEAVPEKEILSVVDSSDANGDGISGRPNYIRDGGQRRAVLGRFGWKANQATLAGQIARALQMDMGITSAAYPANGSRGQRARISEPPEITEAEFETLDLYIRLLAVPMRRNWDAASVKRGGELFTAAGCEGCHRPTLVTGDVPKFPELSRQTIHPYTDMLLHDMGEELADGRPDAGADGREWRTPPLWGIGLVKKVNGHTRFLHDGRAGNLEEAILWHGGEGAKAREAYRNLSRSDRHALIAFIESL